jgi:hypothetical protein
MIFYSEALLPPLRPTKPDDHPLSTVYDCLIYSQLTSISADRSSICKLGTPNAVVIGTGTGDGLLWVRQWTSGFHKIWGIFCLAKDLLASQGGLCSMKYEFWILNSINRLPEDKTGPVQAKKSAEANLKWILLWRWNRQRVPKRRHQPT